MTKHFTNLHVHTEYSLLDGAISLQKLVNFGKEHDFKALAITDHGNIFGAVKFFELCKKQNIKPILGMEAYLTEDVQIKNAEKKYYHLILLVENEVGYRNLCKLISFSYQQGFYFKPRIDYNMLEKYSEGLIATTACLGGHIPSLLMQNNEKDARERLDWFKQIFNDGRFFLEIQPEDQKEQHTLNQKIFRLHEELSIPLIATSDAHFLHADDHFAHEVMLSIQTHDQIDNPNRYTFGDCRVYLRTAQDMLSTFSQYETAIWNTGEIADRCEFDFQTDKLFFPHFEIPQEHTQESYFSYLCHEGLEQLIKNGHIDSEEKEQYQARLQEEIDLITNMGFVGYFLVVSDFIKWAHRNDIPVGPGRGSAAGSLVAWTLEITNIDPLKYNLLFERFLNPERVTMPDIDIDFCIQGRDQVINYVRDKYGHDKVCHIITFGTMMAKGVIKDVARVLGFSFEDSNAITHLIPDQLKITLSQAIEQEPRLQEMIQNNPRVKKLFDISYKLEGLTRHASKHAAGIVISPEPIDEVLPVYVPPKSDELVAQYAMTELERIGFLKIDFLGLKNLTLIKRAVDMINDQHGMAIDINKLPLDDKKTFELVSAGITSGVFQLESDGLKNVLRKLQPEKFEDIIAVNALYRPGPLGSGMVDDFVERRHGRQEIIYLLPELEPILKETYGVIVYQEQVMHIASTIGGYSLGEADILRRAMGKKKVDVMAEQRQKFLERSVKRGFDEKKAGELFDLMAYFAGYGFNKSHSAAYALIAYQTAYLKAHYPAEFMACLISLEAHNADKMAFYLQEARAIDLEIVPPDINKSHILFTVDNGHIIFGLQGIKNIGNAALENIIAEREKKGPFKDLFDFCVRVDLRTSNKRVLEHLICAGAFDILPGNRAQKMHALDDIIDRAVAHKKDIATGQMGLFSQPKKDTPFYTLPERPDWNDKEKLEKEHDVIGFYLSSHPIQTYRKQLKLISCAPLDKIAQTTEQTHKEQWVTCSAFLKSRKDITTKKGDRMTFLQVEDLSSSAEIIVFPKLFAKVEAWLSDYTVFIIKGVTDPMANKCKIKAQEIVPIELILHEWADKAEVALSLPEACNEKEFKELKELLVEGTKGSMRVNFLLEENGKQLRIQAKQRYAFDYQILEAVGKLCTSVKIEI